MIDKIFTVRNAGYGVIHIKPTITEEVKAKIATLSSDIESIEPSFEFLGGNAFHYVVGEPKNVTSISVLLKPGRWHNTDRLVREIEALLN